MRTKLLLCSFAALCVIASSAFAADLLSSMDKGTKAGELPKAITTTAALDCSGAVSVSLNNTYNGDNTNAPNNVTTYGCSTWNESGGEVVYHLYLPTAKMWTASVTSTCDLDLAVLSACDETSPSCLIVVDSGVQTNTPVSGDFYFVVDGYSGARCSFTITFTEVAYNPVDFCQYVQPLDCATVQLAGTTCGGQNLIKTAYACTGYAENGMEKYYSVTLQPGGYFTASVTFPSNDAALYVFDACVEPLNCLVGADDTFSGDAETLTYSNTTLVPQTVYFVIDTYGTSSCGDFTGTFDCHQGVVGVEPASWGTVKGIYR
jgi:hypothetical protein